MRLVPSVTGNFNWDAKADVALGVKASLSTRMMVGQPSLAADGNPATVSFSGLSPQFAGMNQLNTVATPVSGGVISLQIDAVAAP